MKNIKKPQIRIFKRVFDSTDNYTETVLPIEKEINEFINSDEVLSIVDIKSVLSKGNFYSGSSGRNILIYTVIYYPAEEKNQQT